jgi:hypothetical protein
MNFKKGGCAMAADTSGVTGLGSSDAAAPAATEPGSLLPADAAMPAGKLDADNYNAEDLDGVTQNLFGSGNLNYLTLQGRETDAMLATNAGEANISDMEHVSTENMVTAMGARAMADTRDLGVAPGLHGLFQGSDGGAHAVQAISALTASAQQHVTAPHLAEGVAGAAFGAQAFSIFSGNAGGTATANTGHDGIDGASGTDGANGANGANGTNGGGGGDGGGGDVTNIVNNTIDDTTQLVDNTVHNVTNLVDNSLGDVTHIVDNTVGDVTTLVDNTVTTIFDDVTSIVNNTTGDVTSIVNTTLGDVTDIVNNLLPGGGDGDIDLFVHNDLGLPQVDLNLDPLESIVGDINVGVGLTHDASGATVDIGALVANLPLVDASLPVNAPIVGQVLDAVPDANGLLQDPVGALGETVTGLSDAIGNTTGLPGIDAIVQDPLGAVTDTVNTVIGDVTGILAPPAGSDVDLSVHNDLGLPQVDVNLDPVESIVGDIDIGLDVTHTDNGIGLGTDVLALGDQLADNSTAIGLPGGVSDVTAPVVDAVTDTAGTIVSDLSDPAALLQDPAGAVTDIATGLNDAGTGLIGDITDGSLLQDPLSGGGAGDALAPVTDIAGTVVDAVSDPAAALQDPLGTVTDIATNLGDAAGNLLGDVLGAGTPGSSGGDTDLTVTNDLGLPQLDINLDPVESIVGDIDIGVDATHTDGTLGLGVDALALGGQLLDTDTTVMDGGLVGNTVDNLTTALTDGLDHIGSLSGADTAGADTGGDTGTAAVADGGLLDGGLSGLTDTAGGILDQSAGLTGVAEGAIDLLGTVTDPLGAIAGGTDTPSLGDITGGLADAAAWPATETTGVSSAVADTLGSLLGGADDGSTALSSPEGSVSEGLGLLGTGTEHDGGGLLSGLGGAHHGGLFG